MRLYAGSSAAATAVLACRPPAGMLSVGAIATKIPGMSTTPLPEQPHLVRRFSLVPATALNMTNMIGVGPFITIPLLMSALGGPQAMLGWVVALVIVVCDGMVWS